MAPGHWLRVLLYQDLPGIWIARSLEHDIAVEGTTIDAAVDGILRIVVAHVEFDQRHGRSPLSSFPEAPGRYWAAFESATPLRTVTCSRNGYRSGTDRQILIAFTQKRPVAIGLVSRSMLPAVRMPVGAVVRAIPVRSLSTN